MNESLRRSLWTSSALLAVFSLLAKVVGLLRDRILAGQFGASNTLDIYYSAFKIPDLLFNLVVAGAVSSAFIPLFTQIYRKGGGEGWLFARRVITAALIVIAVGAIIAWIFAGPLSHLIAPGFSDSDTALLAGTFRIMLLSTIILAVSSIFGAMLQSFERFLAYSIAPILYNVGIIVGAVFFVPWAVNNGHPSVYALAWGVVLGAGLHWLVQHFAIRRAGFKFSWDVEFSDPSLRRVVRLTIPRTLALGTYNLGTTVINAFASALGAGAITILNIASNLQYVPISLVGISIATAVFPRLSAHASDGQTDHFKENFNQSLRNTFALTTIAAVGIYLFREPIVRILFASGSFQGAAVEETAAVLGIFMLNVVPHSLHHILTRAFYSLEDTRTPFYVSVVSIISIVVLGYLFSHPMNMGVRGLALATAIGGIINFVVLYAIFRRRYLS